MAAQNLGQLARKILAEEGGTIARRVRAGEPETFPLAYARTGPRTSVPTLVLPGGPGLASMVPYRGFRRLAQRTGLDVVMVEHRGVGLSRKSDGTDLPADAVTVEAAADDMAAVLDELGVDRAVVVGSSYGSYLAQAVATRHPERIHTLILDSAKLSVESDLAANRAHRRALFWDGATIETAESARHVRTLTERGEPTADLSRVVQVGYEFAGPEILRRLLRARTHGRLTRIWEQLTGLGSDEVDGAGIPYYLEPAPVASIAFGQLGFGLPTDGLPLDPQLAFEPLARRRPAFAGEPLDLVSEIPAFEWPTVVLSGDRDLRTPRPVAERITGLAADGVLVPLDATGHSALDTHQRALLDVMKAAVAGRVHALPDSAHEISALPRKGASRLVGAVLTAAVRAGTRREG